MELPKNITQVGESDPHCKVYAEDYVISYMKQMNRYAEDKEMAPTLVGRLAVERFGGDSVEIPMDGVTDAVLDAIRDDSYDVAVLALYNARFRAGQRAILRALEEQERPLIVLLMGAPYDLLLIKNAKCIITAYEYTWFAANALLTVIEKGSFKGILPVKLPEELKLADAK